MADRESEILAKLASGVAGLNARRVGRALPAAIRSSATLFSPRSRIREASVRAPGWSPAPILIEEEASRLIAAAPAYLKTHSQGEYVFDHGWAEAWERAGGQYYPKLQVAVPFTPVPGPRLLGIAPAATARRDRGGHGSERPVLGPHHLHRRGRRARSRAARLADPARHPISLVQPRLFGASTISWPR